MTKSNADWFADDAFWETLFPFMFPPSRLVGADEEVERIVALAGVRQGRVLDLACGPGRHAVALARRGFEVTGLDRSPYLLQRARKLAAEESVDVEWVEDDMRLFRRPAAWDLAVSMFTSFGFFETEEENETVLRNLHASLGPGGVLVMDLMGKEILARGYQETVSQEVPGAGLLVQRHRISDGWSRVSNEWLVVEDDRVKRFHFRLWVYSGAELKALLHTVGFGRVSLYGDLSGEPYGATARRLVAVARKEGEG